MTLVQEPVPVPGGTGGEPPDDYRGLRLLLWKALLDEGLVSVPDLFGPSASVVLQRGAREWQALAALLEASTHAPALAGLEGIVTAKASIAALGSSHVLTEFALAPLRLPPAEQDAVIHLGALASFLGGVYDTLLDHSPALPRPMSRALLHSIARGECRGHADAEVAESPGKHLMAILIAEYFRRLRGLVGAQAHAHVLDCLHRSITRMYDAETRTLPEHRSSVTGCCLRRKAALPFVVMGLPGWLAIPEIEGERYRWHLRWLYRLGTFFGQVDDVIDLPSDAVSGQPNQVHLWLEKARYGPETGAVVARQIARAGRCLLSEWETAAGDTSRLPLHVVEAVPTCLVSWLSTPK